MKPGQKPSKPIGKQYFRERMHVWDFPETGMDRSDVYRVIREQLSLDGRMALDLGSFTSTWMHPEAEKIIMETLGKNLVNQFEYQRKTSKTISLTCLPVFIMLLRQATM